MPGRKARGLRLKDKVAIVTGGAYGIGRAFCVGMAAEGARVVAADVNLKAARTTVKEIETKGGQALALKTDVSIVEDTLEMARKTAERFGRIDILVNNAAVNFRVPLSRVAFYDMDVAHWDRVMAVNLKGPFLCARAVFPYMKEQKAGQDHKHRFGHIFLGG